MITSSKTIDRHAAPALVGVGSQMPPPAEAVVVVPERTSPSRLAVAVAEAVAVADAGQQIFQGSPLQRQHRPQKQSRSQPLHSQPARSQRIQPCLLLQRSPRKLCQRSVLVADVDVDVDAVQMGADVEEEKDLSVAGVVRQQWLPLFQSRRLLHPPSVEAPSAGAGAGAEVVVVPAVSGPLAVQSLSPRRRRRALRGPRLQHRRRPSQNRNPNRSLLRLLSCRSRR